MSASPYRIRPPEPAELAAAAAVLAEDDLDDAGEVVLDLGFLRAQWERPGFDLSTDAWVAVDAADMVVAYGQVTRDDPGVAGSWAVVHPAHRGRGLGSALLDRLTARARVLLAPDDEESTFRNAINAGDLAAAELLRSRGLRCVRHFWHMRIDLPAAGSPVGEPAGPVRTPPDVAVTALRSRDDLAAVHAVLDTAFADHWGHEAEPLDEWLEYYTNGSRYDPELWRLAWRDGELVGALTASVLEGNGWVSLLGVAREARRTGVGALLLRSALEGFTAREVPAVYLAVDAENPTGATMLYERVGMRAVKSWDIWERALPPAGR
jgi:mycothiol synthase